MDPQAGCAAPAARCVAALARCPASRRTLLWRFDSPRRNAGLGRPDNIML